jgi:hypothetical protein
MTSSHRAHKSKTDHASTSIDRQKLLHEARHHQHLVKTDMMHRAQAQFLQQQMGWREALDDTVDAAAVQALDDAVAAQERAMHQRLVVLLDEQGDTAAAAAQVRALMFVTRFREALAQRLERLAAA